MTNSAGGFLSFICFVIGSSLLVANFGYKKKDLSLNYDLSTWKHGSLLCLLQSAALHLVSCRIGMYPQLFSLSSAQSKLSLENCFGEEEFLIYFSSLRWL